MSRRLPNKVDERSNLQERLDLWFGTFARYLGLVMIFYSVFIDHLKTPSLLTAGTGLVFLKTVMRGN